MNSEATLLIGPNELDAHPFSTVIEKAEVDKATVVLKAKDKIYTVELEKIKIDGLKTSDVVLDFEGKAFNSEIKKCLRIWPQDNDTEGFFVAKIRKNG